MLLSKYQRESCLEAWLHCEDILNVMPETNIQERKELKQLFYECAAICLGMTQAVRTQSINTEKLALLCVGICEECAEACERFHSSLYKKCAAACRKCADALVQVAGKAVA